MWYRHFSVYINGGREKYLTVDWKKEYISQFYIKKLIYQKIIYFIVNKSIILKNNPFKIMFQTVLTTVNCRLSAMNGNR